MLGSESPFVSSPGLPEGIVFDVENLVVEVGHSGVGVDQVLVDPCVVVLSVHFIYLNNILYWHQSPSIPLSTAMPCHLHNRSEIE